jgi:beta-mannosidase
VFPQNTEITLNTSWEFRQQGTEKWLPANVPGNVHTDLLMNKKIPDPFYADNEQKVQWVENEDWEYRTEFNCDKKTLSQNNIELKFEGLDTYAKVYLNGSLLIETDNMFRSWPVSIKSKVKEGSNSLIILFESAVKRGKAEAAKFSYTLPGEEKVFTRKAQYQYGWDWGPRLVTCGIWKPIRLITWNQLKTESIYAYTREIKDSAAKVDFIFEIQCENEGYYEIRPNLSLGGKNRGHQRLPSQLILLKPGMNTATVTANIPDPHLWWCNGMDNRKPSLYTAGFKITHGDTTISQHEVQFGIRKIELVQDKDSIGSSFYFKLNDVPVFMKGANYIPQHSFLPNVDKDGHRQLLIMAKEANMNMLRVWGGGAYAGEEFYKDCDRAGILVWQDFMFACAMYPTDEGFMENVEKEAKEQVKRLRNHPCIALWCGNNEIDEGWHNWGWQKQFNYSEADSSRIWRVYDIIFNKDLKRIVKQNSPDVSYWPSSPSIGWGHKESLQQGDSHYWGVWWGNEPFDMYEKKVGRFMSEYGFQGMPPIETFKAFCDSAELNLNSVSVKNHQKHPAGYKIITDYMERDYKVPKDFEKFIYISQLVQERGMRTAIEAHRRAKPYCMGTLFWQLNDCWPVTSWSAIDFYNRPKAFYYSLENLYDNVLLSVKKEADDYKIYIINDNYKSIDGRLTIGVCDFSGKEIFAGKADIKVIASTSNSYLTFSEKEMKSLIKEKMYLRCQFISTDGTVTKKTLYYFVPPKDLKLMSIKPEIRYDAAQNILIIKSEKLVKNLYLYSSNIIFEKNYFDLEPNEEIQIKLKSPIKDVSEIKYMSLNNINQ